MTPQLKAKLEAARQSVDVVFSDTSGGPEDNLEALEDLSSHIDMICDTIQHDIDKLNNK